MNQAIAIARNAPDQSTMMATDSRQNALNGATLGDSPLPPTPCPVSRPQATVATSAMPVATNVCRQIGVTVGRRRVSRRATVRSGWPTTLPDADEREHGDHDVGRQDQAAALPTNAASAQVARPTAEHGEAVHREQDAPRPPGRTSVISKIMPDGQRHRRQEQAGQEPEEEGAARRRPGHPPDERAGQRGRRQQQQRQHDEVAGVERRRAEDRDDGRGRATARPSGTRSGPADPRSR